MKTKLIILGLVVIILGGLGLWATKNQTADVISTSDWKTSVIPPISIPSDWKIYTDAEIGYSISYPPEGDFPFIVSDKYSLEHGISGYSISFVNTPMRGALIFNPTLFITKYTNLEYFNKYGKVPFSECEINPKAVCSQITVDGIEALKINTKSIPTGTPMQNVIFTKNNTLFEFSADEKDKEIMEKMLASFKFTK